MTKVVCPISGDLMKLVFSNQVLGKYDVSYYFSEKSGLLKTQTPYWLGEAYADAISSTDTGLVSRNLANSVQLEVMLQCLFAGKGRFLDVAGGYGLLTRLMRDKGFDFYTTDKYCSNLFAGSFEPNSEFRADALFAFEVLEHLEDPVVFLREIFEKYSCSTLIFSTQTFEGAVPSKDWWYYSFETGQHITFYQSRTLKLLAEVLGCRYYQTGSGMHIISKLSLDYFQRAVLAGGAAKRLYSLRVRRMRRGASKTLADHLLMKTALERMQ